MFTGLVEILGKVHSRTSAARVGVFLSIEAPVIAPQLALGESVAVNGVCLTVVATSANCFSFEVGPETLLKTNLGTLQHGERVNLERSLRVGDRLGGHFVQGHVDGVGTIQERRIEGEWEFVRFNCPAEMTCLMVPKGSIAVDGVSLTLVEVGADFFSVMLIPHTLDNTTLGFKKVGDRVNLETDMLAKHVRKLLGDVRPVQIP